jgi:Male sterility protein/Phosphopantetheine attachment site
MPWDVFNRDLGLPKSARHLIPFESQDSSDLNKNHDRSTVIETILSLLDVSLSDFSPDVPFVAYGLDSLGATRISEAIRPYANVSQMQLLGGITWKQLEVLLMGAKCDKSVEHVQLQSTDPMLRMVDKYCKDFGVHKPSKPSTTDEVVLVTGTTGAIGASVLSELVQSTAVRLVYAVNRRPANGMNLKNQQKHSLAIRGLDAAIVDSSKVILLEADLELPDLGFTSQLMERVRGKLERVITSYPLIDVQIRTSITHIIHICA